MIIFLLKRLVVLFCLFACHFVFSLVTIEPNLKKLLLKANMRMEEDEFNLGLKRMDISDHY